MNNTSRSTTFMSLILLLAGVHSCSDNSRKPLTDIPYEGYIQVEGGRVWYKIAGADKSGIPLLVIHGGPGAPHDYLENLEKLSTHRPVIFYDQLDCGNSDRTGDTALWTTERFVNELSQVREFLNLKEIHILGQSWGSMLTVEYILRKKPQGIVSLILAGPFLSAPRWAADQRSWIAALPVALQDTIYKYEASGEFTAVEYQKAMEAYYAKHVCMLDPYPECMNRMMEKMGADVYQYMAGASEFTLNGTLQAVDLSDRLHEIKCPVLFTCGEFDEATPATVAFYQSKLPGSEVHVFKGASHCHHLEKEEEFISVAGDFLKRAETGTID